MAEWKVGRLLALRGNWLEARPFFTAALTKLRDSGAEDLLLQMLAAIGGLELDGGSAEAALVHADEGYEILRRVGMGLGEEQGPHSVRPDTRRGERGVRTGW